MRHFRSLRRAVASGAVALTIGALAVPTAAAAPDHRLIPDADPSAKIMDDVPLADGSHAETVENRWFVQLKTPAVAAGGSETAVEADQKKLADTISSAGIDASITSEYGALWNGVAVSADRANVESLARLDEVVSIKPVARIPRPSAEQGDQDAEKGGSTPQMANALGMTGADVAQSKLGYTGKGVKIGIIDTGIDYDHVEFGGTGAPGSEPATGDGSTSFPGSKVVAGYDFVGNAYNPGSDDPARTTPHPDPYPDDCAGHGTHVAGIAAAKGHPGGEEVTGVAPDAELGSYRVFGCEGDSDAEVMASAMERAAADGMDVVNISISAPFQVFQDYPTAVAAENLAAKGVIVTASQGNEGQHGRWSMSAPASAEHVLAVGSADNAVETNFYLTVSTTPDRNVLYRTAAGSPAVVRDAGAKTPIVASGDPGSDGADEEGDASLLCTAPPGGAYTGSIVLIRRGGCSYSQKVTNAQTGGATGVIVDNDEPADFTVNIQGGATIPVVSISQEDGDAIRGGLTADSTLTFSEDMDDFNRPSGGRASDFTSWGLNESLRMRPDVLAPGGQIRSTWPLDHGGPYQTVGGTSMAAPYTAGASALILQAHPEIRDATDVEAYRQVAWRLHSTAEPVAWTGAGEEQGLAEPIAREGAGLLDVDGAILASTQTDDSVLNIGEYEQHPDGYHGSITVTNHGDSPVTYTLSHQDAVTITGASQSPQRGTASPSTVSSDGGSVTVPARGTARVDATITAPAGIADGDFFGGWIVLEPSTDAEPVRVPFQGVGGNLAKAGVLDPRTGMGNLDGAFADTATYVYGDSPRSALGAYEDFPIVLIAPAIPYRGAVMDVSRVNPDGSTEYLGLANTDESPYTRASRPYLPWSGAYKTADGTILQAPTGQYQLTMRVLPVGDDGKEEGDWATWTSPTFSIDWKTEGYLPQSRLTVTSPDGAQALTDDNIFSTVSGPARASYDVDLGEVREISKVHYTPQQRDEKAHATHWAVQTSVDGVTWTDAGSSDIDPATYNPAILELASPARARYVRVALTNGREGATSLEVAELRVAATGEGPSPEPSSPAASSAPTAAPSAGPQTPAEPTAGPVSSDGAAPGGAGGTDDTATGAAAQPERPHRSLARTGASIGLGAVALAALAGGILLVLRRRRGRDDDVETDAADD